MRGQGKPSGEFKPHAPLNMIPVYRTLQELKASSPSRAHGLSEEDEESWIRAAINLIITAATTLRMETSSICTALELFHSFYAKNSMVTNDRFLMSMACMYLGGKLADFPKSGRDIIYGCVEQMCTPEESIRLRSDSEWMRQTRQALNDAERALLYSIGFRFTWAPATLLVYKMTTEEKQVIATFLREYFPPVPGEEKNLPLNSVVDAIMLIALESTKVPLALQYPAEAIAAACIWLGMKLMKIDAKPPEFLDPKTRQLKQWYGAYGLDNKDVEIIAEQITGSVVGDAEAAEKIINSAVGVKAEFTVAAAAAANGNTSGVVAPPLRGGK